MMTTKNGFAERIRTVATGYNKGPDGALVVSAARN